VPPGTEPRDLKPLTFNPKPQILSPKPQTPNPKPYTPNPKPQNLNPQPQTWQWCLKLAIQCFTDLRRVPPTFHHPLLLITPPHIAHCLGACIIASALFSVAVYSSASAAIVASSTPSGSGVDPVLHRPAAGTPYKNNHFTETTTLQKLRATTLQKFAVVPRRARV